MCQSAIRSLVSPVKSHLLPVEAFGEIALACLNLLQKNETGAIEGRQAGYMQHCQTAVERLLCADTLFAPILSSDFTETYMPRWKALSEALKGICDSDVLIAQILPLSDVSSDDPVLHRLQKDIRKNRQGQQVCARAAMQNRQYSRLLLAFTAALFWQRPSGISGKDDVISLSMEAFAVQRLEILADEVWQCIRDYDLKNDKEIIRCHGLVKQLCHAVEFLLPLFPTHESANYRSWLARLEHLFGLWRGQMTALGFVDSLCMDEKDTVLCRIWLIGRIQLINGILVHELPAFLNVGRPWL